MGSFSADTDYSAIPEEIYQKFQEQYDKNATKRLKKRGLQGTTPVVLSACLLSQKIECYLVKFHFKRFDTFRQTLKYRI